MDINLGCNHQIISHLAPFAKSKSLLNLSGKGEKFTSDCDGRDHLMMGPPSSQLPGKFHFWCLTRSTLAYGPNITITITTHFENFKRIKRKAEAHVAPDHTDWDVRVTEPFGSFIIYVAQCCPPARN